MSLRSKPGDIITGLVLTLLSLCGIVYSISLERPSGWNTAPGLLPLIISALLFAMAVSMVVGGVRGDRHKRLFHGTRHSGSSGTAEVLNAIRPTLTAMAMVALFYFGLLAILWFEAAAFGFLFAMTHLFWPGSTLRRRLAFSTAAPFLFVLVFQLLFNFSLPGVGTLTEFVLFEFR